MHKFLGKSQSYFVRINRTISGEDWCVGCNPPNLAKLPLTPFFLFGLNFNLPSKVTGLRDLV